MWQRSVLTLSLFNLLIQGVTSLPKILISSTKSNCRSIIAPANTKLVISYETSDITVLQKYDSPIWISISTKESKSGTVKNAQDWNEHFKRNLHVKSPKAVKEKIRKEKGSLKYETATNGEVDICIQASKASPLNPIRFAISILKENEIHEHGDVNKDDESDTDRHLSHMEMEMQHLLSSMQNIIAEADMCKQREVHFHQQTLSMHAASMWWPIVQLFVLILTGFTQANHMVKFLRNKRLI
mmetsp:Transcript_13395/g.15378  ORF Transcript_13395/g.15378 Transcript_13395/m.15378 type:complete len:241 (+) Transcript_13395:56-778(+)